MRKGAAVIEGSQGEALGLGVVLLLLGLLALGGPAAPVVPGHFWVPGAEDTALLETHWRRELAGPEPPPSADLEAAWGRLQQSPSPELAQDFRAQAGRYAKAEGDRAFLHRGRLLALELEGLLLTSGCQWGTPEAPSPRLSELGLALLGQARTAGAISGRGGCNRAELLLLRELFLRTWVTLGGQAPETSLHWLESRLLGRWMVEASESLPLDQRILKAQDLARLDPRFSYLFVAGIRALQEGQFSEAKRLLLASVKRQEEARGSAGRLLWILTLTGDLE
jgi:hypothetical protein